VLELGSGTGNDAARLARHGYRVTAVDVSFEAARWAASRYGCNIDFAVVDIAAGLPFLDERFDAVMSNVALHMFADDITRYLFREIGRVVRPGGLLLAHVNATEDRPLRARRLPVIRELGPDYVLEHSGQTTHFFSDAYARQLLVQWATIETTLVEILDPDTDEPFKRVRRVIARR
jgi:SAM-dependent methyltransferase